MADTDHLPSNSYIPQGGGLGRPVDRRQETYQPSGHASRPIPPHGDVSPDGRRVWPQPSMTSRVLVYGGMGIAAAAATASCTASTSWPSSTRTPGIPNPAPRSQIRPPVTVWAGVDRA